MRRAWCRLSLLSLLVMAASSAACSRETGATGLSTALEQEANRIRLLSEFRGSVEYLPSGESYWVAFVPPSTSLPAQLNSDLPVMAGGGSPAGACAPVPGEALVVVSDGTGLECASNDLLTVDRLQVVRKRKGEAVHVALSSDEHGFRVTSLN